MKFVKWLLVSVLFLPLVACVSTKERTQIPSSLKAAEFNSIYSEYLPKPTYVYVNTLTNDTKAIAVEMITYGGDSIGSHSSHIAFPLEHVDGSVAYIDKYLRWEETARNDGDLFTKEIGRIENENGGEKSFGFHSGNRIKHYLTITNCALGRCNKEKEHFYSKEDAILLKKLLLDFKAGKISPDNADDKYQ